MGAIKKGAQIVLLIICLEGTAVARTKFELIMGFMNQFGHEGKQVFDGSGNEKTDIYEPVLFLEHQITPKTRIFGSFLADLWSSASEAIFDTDTGASGRAVAGGTPDTTLKRRIALDLGVSQKIKTWTITPRAGYAYEFDYRSINGGLRVDKSFAKDNFILSLDYHAYFDKARPLDAASGEFTPWQPKRVHTVNVSGSQILTPSDLILVGYSFTHQSGFLSGTENSVDLNGNRVSEVLPDRRLRHAATLRYIHGFTDALAVHIDNRLYFDDWGILSPTFEPSLYLAFNDDSGLIKFFYRFYLQSASTYYQDSFPVQKRFMTSDSDLASFQAHEGGTMISYQWDFHGWVKAITLSGAGLYYHRSNGLSAAVYEFGFGGAF
ncbi:MAG: DUF3570 domain-containing protein [Deltaproteobacteria bacterium]|nr:DUF3570 domain-containing protein [Deltaproteobacteria bacterium]